MTRRGTAGPGGAPGFTLVEMLVTLVVVSLVTTLLWQALAQVAKLELRLAEARLLDDRAALPRAWVQQALQGITTGPQGDPAVFEGDTTTLQGTTTTPPWPRAGGLQRMTLTLQPEDGATPARTLLLASDGTAPPLPLWQWDGPGRFEYLDRSGRWHARWPALAGEAGMGTDANQPAGLPLAIRLIGPPDGPLWVSVVALPSPMISRRDVLQADDSGQ